MPCHGARCQGVIKLPRMSNSKYKTPIHMCSSFGLDSVEDWIHMNATQFDNPACMHIHTISQK